MTGVSCNNQNWFMMTVTISISIVLVTNFATVIVNHRCCYYYHLYDYHTICDHHYHLNHCLSSDESSISCVLECINPFSDLLFIVQISRSLTHSHSLFHSSTDWLTDSLTDSLTVSLPHSLTPSVTYILPLTYSLSLSHSLWHTRASFTCSTNAYSDTSHLHSVDPVPDIS